MRRYEDPYLVIASTPPITSKIAIVTTSRPYFLPIVPGVTSIGAPERLSDVQQTPTEQSNRAPCTLHVPSKIGSYRERANKHSTSSTHSIGVLFRNTDRQEPWLCKTPLLPSFRSFPTLELYLSLSESWHYQTSSFLILHRTFKSPCNLQLGYSPPSPCSCQADDCRG